MKQRFIATNTHTGKTKEIIARNEFQARRKLPGGGQNYYIEREKAPIK